MTAPNAAERAAVLRGAALLDKKRPGWWHEIDIDDAFDIRHCGRCIAGQIGAHHVDAAIDAIELDLADRCEFEVACYRAGLRVLGLADDDAHRYGFNDGPRAYYDGLTAAWRELIAGRRAVRVDEITVDVGDLDRWRDATARIVRTPGICSGVPRIEDTRTPVSTVRAWWDEGADDATVLAAYPHLTAAYLDAVRAWLAPLQCAAVLRDADQAMAVTQ